MIGMRKYAEVVGIQSCTQRN